MIKEVELFINEMAEKSDDELKDFIDQSLKAWEKGLPIITDYQYDVILEEYLKRKGESSRPYLRAKQSDDVNDIVGTLSKTFGVEKPIIPNRPTYVDMYEKNKNVEYDTCIIVQPKFDGVSIAFDVNENKFYTRGDYENGESIDVTELFISRKMKEMYKDLSAIKFEGIMSVEAFDKSGLSVKYKRPRDAVQAIITSRNKELCKLIALIPLRGYKNKQQHIPDMLDKLSMTTLASDFGGIQTFIDELLNNGAKIVLDSNGSFECDGVVTSIIDEKTKDVIGDEVAIKILSMIKQCKFKKIKYNFGNSGRITPVAEIEPVKFGNVVVSKMTLSNIERIIKLRLKENDTIDVMYNIVPYLIDSHHDGDIPVIIPDKCPACGTPFDLSSLTVVKCVNHKCKGFVMGSIIRHCEKMKMMGLSTNTIYKLFEDKVISSISDLYKLKVEDISSLGGFGEKSATNIINSIKKASKDVRYDKFLGSFPMDSIGSRIWGALINEIKHQNVEIKTIDELIKFISENENMKGFGSITRHKMATGLAYNKDEIIETYKYISFKNNEESVKDVIGIVTLTGTRDKTLINYLTDKGYEIDNFSKKTIAVVIPDNSFKSVKVDKAKSNNIPVYTISEAYEKL